MWVENIQWVVIVREQHGLQAWITPEWCHNACAAQMDVLFRLFYAMRKPETSDTRKKVSIEITLKQK